MDRDYFMDFLKKIFFAYQKMFFYINIAKGEYAKVSGLLYETLGILTLLAVRGITPKFWQVALIYVFILFGVGTVAGKFLAWLGIVKYNNSLSNTHNPEITEILERVKRIEEKIK